MPDLPVPLGPINTVISFGSTLMRWKHLKSCRVMFVITVTNLWPDYRPGFPILAVSRLKGQPK